MLVFWCGLAALASVIAMALTYAPDAEPARAYYGSDTRAFGLLVGCALAVVLVQRNRPGHAAPRRSTVLIPVALGLGWALAAMDDAGPVLYRGGLALVVLAVAVLIFRVETRPTCLPARLLALPPLPTLGRVSYEIYLWHWPVFLVLDHERTGLSGGTLLAVRCGLTLLLAAMTYRLLSRPVRTRRWPRRRPVVATVTSMAMVVVAAVVLTIPPHAEKPKPTVLEAGSSPLLNRKGRLPGEPRVTIFGDSVAHSLAAGLPPTRGFKITDRSIIGCGIARPGPVRNAATIQRPYAHCDEWDRVWAAGVRADRPDVALVVLARWEALDRKLNGHWRHIGDPDYDAYLRTELTRMIEVLTADGARVVLTTAPYSHRYERRDGSTYPEDDPARTDAWNRMLEDTAGAAPGRVRILDLGARLCPHGRYTRDVHGVRLRSDGLHLAPDGVRTWVSPWLLPRLVAALG
jgi:hypothetical protein